ncbi:MAG: hybrid sensor histidine kinase/response regulator, partial [Deltaproteobacteria bacterium]|nr:hybrid sensor histidine kinase/response regulator [Deltaproteobacteria bacterium]
MRSTIPTTIDIQQDIQATDETILADPTQINQVMMNLCINASQAMEQTGGNLTVNMEKVILDDNSAKDYPDLKSGKHVKVTVSDTGPGIDPEIIERIFDPYFTTKEVGKGSGMGLSVVLGIVKNHNGAISVDSNPGKGTTF